MSIWLIAQFGPYCNSPVLSLTSEKTIASTKAARGRAVFPSLSRSRSRTWVTDGETIGRVQTSECVAEAVTYNESIVHKRSKPE